MWIALVAVYGLFKGVRDITKKKALMINTTIEVLFVYTFLSFILSAGLAVFTEDVSPLALNSNDLLWIALKSAIIFIAWICSFKAIDKLPIGFYGIMDMSRVIMAAVLSVIFLKESVTALKAIGLLLVLIGLLLVNVYGKNEGDKRTNAISLILVLISCLMNAISEIFDKYLMSETALTSSQLQFWYMLFLVVLYLLYLIVTRTKLDLKKIFKNYWLILMSVLFVIGDKSLFEACKYNSSSVITMTLIKQCSILITIIGGRLVFGEKNIIYKLICAGIIIFGIIISLL